MSEDKAYEDNICKICGNFIQLEYTITLARCKPLEFRITPTPFSPFTFCSGHEVGSSPIGGDWDKLTSKQQYDVDQLRSRISDYLIAQGEAFYQEHPELRLTWSMTLDALIRDGHDTREEL